MDGRGVGRDAEVRKSTARAHVCNHDATVTESAADRVRQADAAGNLSSSVNLNAPDTTPPAAPLAFVDVVAPTPHAACYRLRAAQRRTAPERSYTPCTCPGCASSPQAGACSDPKS